jgi:hypothetical protein
MVYIDVNETNEWVLNINNNVRDPFPQNTPDPAYVVYRFKHILSDKDVGYLMYIDPPGGHSSTDVAFGVTNGRYTEFWWNQTEIPGTLVYDGEYDVTITNENNVVLYNGIWKITGNSEVEENPFVEFQSDNEDNNSFIYIEE